MGAGGMLGWGKPRDAELDLSFPWLHRIGFTAILFFWQKNEINFQAWMKTHWQHGLWAEGSARPGGGGVWGVAVAVLCPLQHEPRAVLGR